MIKETRELLELSRQRLEQVIEYYDSAASYIKVKSNKDKDQVVSFTSSYIYSSLLSDVLTNLTTYSFLNGYKIDDFKAFQKATNFFSYISKVCEVMDSSYALIDKLRSGWPLIEEVLKDKYTLEQLNASVVKNYKNWADVYQESKLFRDTHIRILGFQILDFIKYSDFYYTNLYNLSFDESQGLNIDSLFGGLVDLQEVLFPGELSTRPFHREYHLVEGENLNLARLNELLKKVPLRGFKHNFEKNPIKYLYRLIQDTYNHAQKTYLNKKPNHVEMLINKFETQESWDSDLEAVLRNLDKSFLNDLKKDFDKIKFKDVVISGEDFYRRWYNGLFTGINHLIIGSLFGIFEDSDERRSFELPTFQKTKEKDMLNFSLISHYSKKFNLVTIKHYLKCLNLYDRINDKILKEEFPPPIGLSLPELEAIKEINIELKSYLTTLKEGVDLSKKDERLSVAYLKPAVMASSLCFLVNSLETNNILLWRKYKEEVEKKFTEKPKTDDLSPEIARILSRGCTPEWTAAETAKSHGMRTLAKGADYLKSEDETEEHDVFIPEDINEDRSGVGTVQNQLEDRLRKFVKKYSQYEASIKKTPAMNEYFSDELIKAFKDAYDHVDIITAAYEELIKLQSSIRKLRFPVVLRPGSGDKRILDVIKGEKSAYYENELFQKWCGCLKSAVDIEGKGYEYYRKVFRTVKEKARGMEILRKAGVYNGS